MVHAIQDQKEITMDKLLNRLVWPVIIAPAVYLAFVWQQLPEQVAMHFDWKGNPDRMGSRSEMITTTILLTVLNAVVYLIVTNVYRIDPKRYAAENKSRLRRIGFAVALFLSLVLTVIIYSSVKGDLHFGSRLILAAVGLLFALMGNYMHNIKPNYFAGIRLPWTLENEDNWKQTHALAGRLWFAGGLLIAVICIFVPQQIAFVIFMAIMITITLIPCIFSYRLYARSKKQLNH